MRAICRCGKLCASAVLINYLQRSEVVGRLVLARFAIADRNSRWIMQDGIVSDIDHVRVPFEQTVGKLEHRVDGLWYVGEFRRPDLITAVGRICGQEFRVSHVNSYRRGDWPGRGSDEMVLEAIVKQLFLPPSM